MALAEQHRDLARGMAVRYAARWRVPHLVDDLEGAALLGLVRAERAFRGGDFRAYASRSCSRSMLDCLRDVGWPVRLPRNQRSPAPRWTRVALWHAEQEHGGLRDPEPPDERLETVVAAVDLLPEPFRATMRAHYLHDWPKLMLARRWGLHREGIRQRLRKGRQLVREMIHG